MTTATTEAVRAELARHFKSVGRGMEWMTASERSGG